MLTANVAHRSGSSSDLCRNTATTAENPPYTMETPVIVTITNRLALYARMRAAHPPRGTGAATGVTDSFVLMLTPDSARRSERGGASSSYFLALSSSSGSWASEDAMLTRPLPSFATVGGLKQGR